MADSVLNKEGEKAFLEYIIAHQEVMQSMEVEEQKASSFYSVGSTEAYVPTQTPDLVEEEVKSGPSQLMQAMQRLSDYLLNSSEPDPMVIGMAIMGEEKWTDKQRMAAWLLCSTKYKETLSKLNIDASMIPNPALEKPKAVVKPIKELFCDDRTMGFVMRFRYLPVHEFKAVRDGVAGIVGRQYHSGNAVGARFNEPHWVISGDAPSTKSLVNYLWVAFNGVNYTKYKDSDHFVGIPPEPTEWTIAPDVADRMQLVLNRASKLRAMSSAHFSDWRPKNDYGVAKKLFPYQMAGIEYILTQTEESRISQGRYGAGVLVGDPMGLGKTCEAICGVTEAWERQLESDPNLKRENLRVLIICPAAVKITWQREVAEWVGKFGYTSQILRGNRIQPIWGNFVICNPSLIKKDYDQETFRYEPSVLYTMILAQRWFGITADESHQFKNERAQRTINTLELFSGKRWDATRMTSRHWRFPVPIRVMLSGSPVLNRPEEFASQLDALGVLDQFGGRSRFERTYCAGRYRNRLIEMHERLMERGYLRREKEDMALTPDLRVIPIKNIPKYILDPAKTERDNWARLLEEHEYEFLPGVLGQLPPKISTPVIVPLSNRNEYAHAERYFLLWLREHFKDMEDVDQRVGRAARNEALVKFNMLKHLAENGKVKAFIEWADQFMAETEDQKLVVYVDHLDVHKKLVEHFENSRQILGGQQEKIRQQNIDDFQNNPKVRIIVCMLTAGGIGITLTAANHLAFLALGWTPAIHDQAEARIWGRVNDLHGASVYWFIADKTVDQQVARLIDKKRDVVTASTQGAEVDATSLINEAAMELLRARESEATTASVNGSEPKTETDSDTDEE